MIDEKRLAELRQEYPLGHHECPYPLPELFDSLDMLWKIARAARHWTIVPAGRESCEAEAALVELLEPIKKL